MSASDKMTVLVVEPEKAPYTQEINNDLGALQKAVGGYIQAVYPYEEPVAIIVNEEGKLNGLPLNRALRNNSGSPYDVTAGTMLIVGLGEEDFCSLTPELLQKFTEKFKTPELFLSIGGKLMVMPMEPKPEVPDKSQVPVYRYSGAYAIEHNQLTVYKQSFQLNIDCKDAIEQAIAAHYSNNSLGKDVAAEVIEQFGAERVAYVLANTIRQMDWDGRISPDNKAWAKSVLIYENKDPWGMDRNMDFMVTRSHPGLIDLVSSQVRRLAKEQEKDRPSVMEQLHKKVPAPPSNKKAREQER